MARLGASYFQVFQFQKAVASAVRAVFSNFSLRLFQTFEKYN